MAISEFQVVEHLRLGDWPAEDMLLLETYIETAVARLDAKQGLLGLCLLTQTWKLTLPCFPSKINVPLPPCQTIDSVKYIDGDDAEITMPTADYQVFNIHSVVNTDLAAGLQAQFGTTFSPEPAIIIPATGKSFPSTKSDHLEAVAVTFTAGFGQEFNAIPKSLQHAMAMDIGHMYEHRESFMVGSSFSEVPMGYMDLVSNFRQWSF